MARLQAETIALDPLLDEVRRAGDGAVVLFVGTVRDHHRGRAVTHLEYHAYAELAEAELARIEQEAVSAAGASRVAVVHRTGRLELGEISVAVAAAAAHRPAAFAACRFAIEALKRRVPIWKKEFGEGGAWWVEGQADGPLPDGTDQP